MESGSEQARGSDGRLSTGESTVACLGPAVAERFVEMDSPPRLVAGQVCDHALVYSLLRAVNQAPSHDDFVSWLDEPSYEPSDRLLVKHGAQIVAHAHLLHRMASFQGVRLPVAGLQDLAVLPEYARAGYERLLIYAAEQSMRESRAVVSLVCTDRPEPFVDCGWSELRALGYSRASVGDVLAHLSANTSAAGN